ncbi:MULTISPECIES: hypothetical protein [unclassified Caballeronia]|uniref:hypothetical protein n=1 Tax=unclassified Caballeronia TaxID=2646786 RepID=UPI0028660F9E|nr:MULTISPECIES: hypothetical protein [unclassified Caballeronia]MDR5777785.1 hypothetical protein [Caballeronia sp. LZ002]MDR5853220.1 hypothetical protein [Caballeronia sp. LZ003]
MDYFKEAFGGFNPQLDEDAALKFALDVVFADHRLRDLIRVISFEQGVGGIEGEPGWMIEHREEKDINGYEEWPKNATFRSRIDPEFYSLAHPEFYCDGSTFRRYVEAISDVFAVRHPERKQELDLLRATISRL